MTAIEEKYVYTTVEQSICSKDWAAGSSALQTSTEFVVRDGKPLMAECEYPPSLLKLFDEAIVNCLDHYIRNPRTVTQIIVNFTNDGTFSIENNGPGIEVVRHPVTNTWVPEMISTMPYQGCNARKSAQDITGGTNGLGLKIIRSFSQYFEIQTCDGAYNYCQVTEDGTLHNPVITESTRQYTRITFKPHYCKIYGYPSNETGANAMRELLTTRLILAAPYTRACIYLNGGLVQPNNLADLAALLGGKVHEFHIGKIPWHICCVARESFTVSIVNGMVVKSGSHIKFIQRQIVDFITANIGVKIEARMIRANLSIFMICRITGARWEGQRKDRLAVSTKLLEEYVIPRRELQKLHDEISPILLDLVMGRKQRRRNEKITYKKYWPAQDAGRGSDCSLLLAEGDSAAAQVVSGITDPAAKLGFKKYGVLSLGGVIVNARKDSRCVVVGGRERRIIGAKFRENKVMQALIQVLGLNPDLQYTSKSEMATLRYSSVVAVVDQDYDGVGFIFGLVLNLFHAFWPALFAAGFIKRFATPIIRCYHGGGSATAAATAMTTPLSFYTQAQFEHWAHNRDLRGWRVQYYKGLGTHDAAENKSMFREFHKHLYVYHLDERSDHMFRVYFDDDTALRKAELALPVVERRQDDSNSVNCTDHLQYETKLYQKDNIERKLSHVVDGMNQSGRKILDGCIKTFARHRGRMKVAQLAGSVAMLENYHHGEDSLADSIKKRAFIAPGGRQMPILLPYGNFGSRLEGGADSAKARYIFTELNTKLVDLVYPRADYHLLEFVMEEGQRCEPRWFVPIVPTVLLESVEMPATGWKIQIWARDVIAVTWWVESMIWGKKVAGRLPPCCSSWTGRVIRTGGNEWSLGSWRRVSSNVIQITELPLGVWTMPYYESIADWDEKYPELIAEVINNNSDTQVNIIVKFESDRAVDYINETWRRLRWDGITEFFKLRMCMQHNINLIGVRGEVLELSRYEDVMDLWFPARRDLYVRRIDREIELMELKKEYLENVERYVLTHREIFPEGVLKCADIDGVLKARGFKMFDRGRLKDPGFCKDVRSWICGDTASYDYLVATLTDRDKTRKAADALAAKLAKVREKLRERRELAAMGPFKGSMVWLRELAEMRRVVVLGRDTGWTYKK